MMIRSLLCNMRNHLVRRKGNLRAATRVGPMCISIKRLAGPIFSSSSCPCLTCFGRLVKGIPVTDVAPPSLLTDRAELTSHVPPRMNTTRWTRILPARTR
jgi:hypothetical protein